MLEPSPGNLSGTVHLQSLKSIVVDVEGYLHRLAADLAILDVGLAAARQVEDDFHRLRAIRAADPRFNDLWLHDRPG
jgi:hypothetical protein